MLLHAAAGCADRDKSNTLSYKDALNDSHIEIPIIIQNTAWHLVSADPEAFHDSNADIKLYLDQ
jgi:hypothetical protein